MFLVGFLSFSAIVREFEQLYLSLWGYKIFTLPSNLFVIFIILISLAALLSAGLTYIQLSVEDHKWWWRSVLCAGSTALFMCIKQGQNRLPFFPDVSWLDLRSC
ncbi:hypothetical protein DITRI_Ditri05aG0056300 [Diplodiscus trichospermus]